MRKHTTPDGATAWTEPGQGATMAELYAARGLSGWNQSEFDAEKVTDLRLTGHDWTTYDDGRFRMVSWQWAKRPYDGERQTGLGPDPDRERFPEAGS